MGKTACEYSDFVFITSDNPRTENPEQIINDITEGLNKEKYFKITDRTLAIKSALYSAQKGDTVLIAGKGHEKYQILGTQKIYFQRLIHYFFLPPPRNEKSRLNTSFETVFKTMRINP